MCAYREKVRGSKLALTIALLLVLAQGIRDVPLQSKTTWQLGSAAVSLLYEAFLRCCAITIPLPQGKLNPSNQPTTTIHFFVNIHGQQTFPMMYESTTTVKKVKEDLSHRTHIHPTDQNLMLNHYILQNSDTLQHYNIHQHSTLHLTFSLKGGTLAQDVNVDTSAPTKLAEIDNRNNDTTPANTKSVTMSDGENIGTPTTAEIPHNTTTGYFQMSDNKGATNHPQTVDFVGTSATAGDTFMSNTQDDTPGDDFHVTTPMHNNKDATNTPNETNKEPSATPEYVQIHANVNTNNPTDSAHTWTSNLSNRTETSYILSPGDTTVYDNEDCSLSISQHDDSASLSPLGSLQFSDDPCSSTDEDSILTETKTTTSNQTTTSPNLTLAQLNDICDFLDNSDSIPPELVNSESSPTDSDPNTSSPLNTPPEDLIEDTSQDHSPFYDDRVNNVMEEPISTIRLMTWNIANKFDNSDPYLNLFAENNYSLMALQEPCPAHKFNPTTIKYLQSTLAKLRILLLPTPYQYVLINEETIGNCMLQRKIIMDGRAISITFHSNIDPVITTTSNHIMTIISIYGVTSGDNTYKEGKHQGMTRKVVRQQLQDELENHLCELKQKFPNQQLILLGDLQDTISTSAIDNSIPEHALVEKWQ